MAHGHKYINDDALEYSDDARLNIRTSGPGAKNCSLCTIAGIAGESITARQVRDNIIDRSKLTENEKTTILREYEEDPENFCFNIVTKGPALNIPHEIKAIYGVLQLNKFVRTFTGNDEFTKLNRINSAHTAAQALVIAWYFEPTHNVYYLGNCQYKYETPTNDVIRLMKSERSKVQFAVYLSSGHWEVAENVPTSKMSAAVWQFMRGRPPTGHTINGKTLTFTDYQTDNVTYASENPRENFPRNGYSLLNPLDSYFDEEMPEPDYLMAIALFPKSLKDHTVSLTARKELAQ